jgi:hypothetical protein
LPGGWWPNFREVMPLLSVKLYRHREFGIIFSRIHPAEGIHTQLKTKDNVVQKCMLH